MKIRKLKIKNYQIFDDIELDFTDKDGKTLNTIVLAGINGSGKTTVLELLTKLFSTTRYKQSIYDCYAMNSYDFFDITKGNSFELINCEQIQLELEISTETKISMINRVKGEYTTISKMNSKNQRYNCTLEIIESVIKLLETSNNILNLTYKTVRKDENCLKLEINNFILFGFIHRNLIKPKICYIPAETYLNYSLPYTITEEQLERKVQEQNDGIVYHVNFDAHKYIVEKHMFKLIAQSIDEDRDKKINEVIDNVIKNIDKSISDTKLITKLVDINFRTEKPIFESPNHKRISIDNLSSGEKQIFYQAVYLGSQNLKNSILMVDEPETSLHPTWQQEILKLYQNIGDNNQVIVATHSPHVISSVKPENLFVFYVAENKVKVFNAEDKGLHTKGNEPNDILDEIMGTPLRDFETQNRIDELSKLLSLYPDKYNKPEAENLIDSLTEDLGKRDPFIMRLKHQLMMIKRKISNK